MQFHTYTTTREACIRSGAIEDPDEFYREAFAEAIPAPPAPEAFLLPLSKRAAKERQRRAPG